MQDDNQSYNIVKKIIIIFWSLLDISMESKK